MDSARQPNTLPRGTSGEGIVRSRSSALHAFVLLGGLLVGTETGFALCTDVDAETTCALLGTTSVGVSANEATLLAATDGPLVAAESDGRHSVLELRHLSGLTWEQIGRVLGVTPRTVHFWASGKRMTATHEERVERVLATVKRVFRGHASTTRRALLSSPGGGALVLDMLADGRFGDVEEALGVSQGRAVGVRGPSSPGTAEVYRPLPLSAALGALHGSVHKEPEERRRVRARRRE